MRECNIEKIDMDYISVFRKKTKSVLLNYYSLLRRNNEISGYYRKYATHKGKDYYIKVSVYKMDCLIFSIYQDQDVIIKSSPIPYESIWQLIDTVDYTVISRIDNYCDLCIYIKRINKESQNILYKALKQFPKFPTIGKGDNHKFLCREINVESGVFRITRHLPEELFSTELLVTSCRTGKYISYVFNEEYELSNFIEALYRYIKGEDNEV